MMTNYLGIELTNMRNAAGVVDFSIEMRNKLWDALRSGENFRDLSVEEAELTLYAYLSQEDEIFDPVIVANLAFMVWTLRKEAK